MLENDVSDLNMTEVKREKALQDIQTIKRFLESGQRALEDNGFHFMFWGLLIPVSTLLFQFGSSLLGYDHIIVILFWPVISFFGAIVSVVAGIKSSKKRRGNEFVGKLTASLWIGILIALFVLFLINYSSGKIFNVTFLCMISLVLGLGYWFYGSVIQLFWFKMVGPLWWISAIVMAGREWTLVSPIMAGTTFICSFVPGIILFKKRHSIGS